MAELFIPNDAFMAAAEVGTVDDDTIDAILAAAAPLIVAAELERMAGMSSADGPWWALGSSLRHHARELRGEQW